MLSSRLHRCLEPGLAIFVATVDAGGRPMSCRGVALKSDDDLETITVYLPVATSHETIQNIATTRRLAIATTHPTDHCATQLKGTAQETRLSHDHEAAFVRSQVDAFALALDRLGVPKRMTHSMAHWPAFAIRVRVEQIFEQSPGPNAGAPLR